MRNNRLATVISGFCSAFLGSRKFCQRGSKFDSFFFFFLVDEGFEDLNTTINEWAIIGPPAKPHLNGVSLAGADDCPTLNAGFVASRFSGDPDQY